MWYRPGSDCKKDTSDIAPPELEPAPFLTSAGRGGVQPDPA